MIVDLAYGSGRLAVDLPEDRTTVIGPQFTDSAPDQFAEIVRAIREPVCGPGLRDLAKPGQTVAISVCDGTRPQPRHLMVPAVLNELEGVVRLEDIVVLVATGTHRGNTEGELRAMLSNDVYDAVRVVNHDARNNDSLMWVGRFGADVPVWLMREWVEADLRITTGFVEPHFFAGFSGGPKLVAPGLAGLDTVLTLHDARRIGHPQATWGVREGNPVHDDVRAIAAGTRVDFSVDVVLNTEQHIVAAFAGPTLQMHTPACALVQRVSMRAVKQPFDIVVTTNSGFPLDQNLYQAVKGMSAAAKVVAQDGLVVAAAECRDGFPEHGLFRRMLAEATSPASLLEEIQSRDECVPDQWQAQVLAKIQGQARVVVHNAFLSRAELNSVHLEGTDDISATVHDELARRGPQARVCVLPEGPQTIPYLT